MFDSVRLVSNADTQFRQALPGAPALTMRGLGSTEASAIVNLMADVLEAPENDAVIGRVAAEGRFRVHGPSATR